MPNKSLVINMLPPTNVVAVRQCFQLCLCVCPQGWHPHLTITLDAIGQLKVIWGLPPTALTIQGPLLPPSHQTTNPPGHVQTCSLCITDCWQTNGWHSTEMPSIVLNLFVKYSHGRCCPKDVNM